MVDVLDRPRRQREVLAAAAILALLFTAVAVWWVGTDTRPQQMDPSTHLRRSLAFADAFRNGSPHQVYSLWRAEYGMYTYPPLFHVATGAVIAAGATPIVAAVLINSLFAWLLASSVINLGRAAFNFATGVAAATLALSFMTLAFLHRTAYPDFGLTAMVAWCCWRLLLTDAFSNRRASIIFGLAVGAGMLVKQMALPFTAIAAGCLMLINWRRLNRGSVVNIVFAGVATLAVALPWYGLHYRIMRQVGHFNQYIAPAREGDPMPWTFDGATYYLQTTATQLGPPLIILAIAGAISWFLLARRSNSSLLPADPRARQARLIILAWLIGGLLLVTFVLFNKDYRYHAPMLPALALVMASLLAWPIARLVRLAVIALMFLAAAPYFFLVTIGTSNPAVPRMLMTQWNMPPVREDWRIAQLIDDVAAHLDAAHPSRLGIVPHCESYGHPSIHLEFASRHVPVHIEGFEDKDPPAAASMDLVLTKTGEQGQEMLEHDPELINRYIAENPTLFTSIANYSLPDGSSATLYRVNRPKEQLTISPAPPGSPQQTPSRSP